MNLVVAASMPFLALLLAVDVATTSSRCDLLMDQLNAARIQHGPQHHIRISWLTTSLKELVRADMLQQARICEHVFVANVADSDLVWLAHRQLRQNCGQGLGFLLGHTVIDRKTLVHAAVKLASAIATVYSVLLALAQSSSIPSAPDACSLTRAQHTVISATAQAVLNGSCSYNVTLMLFAWHVKKRACGAICAGSTFTSNLTSSKVKSGLHPPEA